MSNFQVQNDALFVHDLTTNEANFRVFGPQIIRTDTTNLSVVNEGNLSHLKGI